MSDPIDHPPHYGGKDNPYEAIKVIEAWGLGFCLGNALKYIARAGKKTTDRTKDLRKAMWYLNREIGRDDQTEADEPFGWFVPDKTSMPDHQGMTGYIFSSEETAQKWCDTYRTHGARAVALYR